MRITTRTILTAFCLAAGPFCSEKLLHADGITLDGVSAVSIGRGGTNLGFADNTSILHDNAAAMGQIEGDAMLQLGGTFLFTHFDYGDADNTQQRSQNQMYPIPEIGYVERLSDQWALGVGVYTPNGFGSIYNLEGPVPFGGPQVYESFGSLTKVLIGASYTPEDYDFLSIGGTLGPGLSFVNLEGPYTLQSAPATGLPSLLDLGVDGVGITWSAGLSCRLTDRTTVGFSYLSQVEVDADGEVGLVSPLGQTYYNAETKVTWPRSFGGGFRHQLTRNTVIATDVIWYNWSDAFDTLEINLSSPTNAGYPPNVVERFPLNWVDTVSTRVGVEHRLGCGHIVRAGYVHHKSPIPYDTITPWIPGALEHAFSLGYGFDWRGWQVSTAYMYSFGPTVEVGTSAFVGGDFDQSIHRNRTHALAFGFTRTFGAR
ncbi:MAG: outer membrane protein transport protein [Planctomycetota bacterium]